MEKLKNLLAKINNFGIDWLPTIGFIISFGCAMAFGVWAKHLHEKVKHAKDAVEAIYFASDLIIGWIIFASIILMYRRNND